MSMNNESALIWLGDEVQATLAGIHTELERLSDMNSIEQRQSVLVECEAKFHSVAGAFDVVGYETLSRFAVALQNVLQLWSASSVPPTSQELSQTVTASQNLYNFLQVIKENKAYSELSLYTSYRCLGDILSQSFHPMDLWRSDDYIASRQALMQVDVLQELHAQAVQHLNFVHPTDVKHGDVDLLMLEVIRHKKLSAVGSLCLICDDQIRQNPDENSLILRGSLLSVVMQALSQGHLELDVFLKRYLLGHMAWLKSDHAHDERLDKEAVFFSYIAWQKQALAEDGLAQKHAPIALLDRLASWTNWQSLKGAANYEQTIFGQQSRDQILHAQEAVNLARQVWADFCSNEIRDEIKVSTTVLQTSFEKMGQSLIALHAMAEVLSRAFYQIVSNPALCVKREIQVEVATNLLILNGVIINIKSLGNAEIEQQFLDLARRLTYVQNGQAPGAFDPWMLDLQQRQSWIDAMTSSIQQLGHKLKEVESIFEHAWSSHESMTGQLTSVPDKLQQIGAIADTLKLNELATYIQSVEEKVKVFLHGNEITMDLIMQEQIAADMGALGLMLSMWAHKPDQMRSALSFVTPPAIQASTLDLGEIEHTDTGLDIIETLHVPSLAIDLPPATWLDLPLEEESQLKTIGSISISIPLYKAYLSETDEWSRQLALALSEWALDENHPIPSQTLTWAHALAGSSATIGFTACADLAKSVERLIEKVQEQQFHSVDLARTLSRAADEIRRLLHQFAAGFMKSADVALIAKVENYLQESPVVLTEPESSWESAPISATDSAPVMTSADAEMLAIFKEESAQLIPELGVTLRAWEQLPEHSEHKTQALRILHTLKGSARLVGEQALASQAHELESQIEAHLSSPDEQSFAELFAAYDQLVGKPAVTVTTLTVPQAASSNVQFVPTVAAGETIRVQSNTIDRLVNQTGEVMIARSRMEAEMSRSLRTLSDMGTQVQRLREQLRELELQTESQMQSRQAQVIDLANSFDPLELDRFTRTQELTRFMAEALSDVSTLQRGLQRSLNATEDDLAAQLRQTRDLQRHLLRTRMVEFDSVAERLYRLVRITSQELDKSVELTIQNGGQEMDRSVLERMVPAFEHLLRNAVVHGIELSSVREANGKNAQGKIHIQLTQQSNDVIVILRDDGQGIDEEAIRQKAKQLPQGSDANANPKDLIFMSGLSTAGKVSELAGRGIGLDVVRAQVFALGGRIEVDFKKSEGTTFKLILPLTTAVTQIVLVRTGTLMTGIPGNLVLNVLRVKSDVVSEAQASGQFTSGNQSVPFYGLNRLLQYKAQMSEPEQATQSIMLLQSAGQVIAVHVDEVLGNQEVMVKNLGIQLGQMPGLSGMTVLPTGPTVLIYNPVALASVYGARLSVIQDTQINDNAEGANVRQEVKEVNQAPLITVVDDSITMRRVLQRLLLREGYRVSLAADGSQALDTLRLEKPILVLSDVEMPRMDGFELLRNIRASDRLSDLPVVMITSRIADKHRDHAKSLGANEYLGKPYSEEELLQVLQRYAKKLNH